MSELLENFKHPDMNVRHRTRVEISERDTDTVVKATEAWVKQFDPAKKEDGIPMLEALSSMFARPEQESESSEPN